MKRRNFLLTTAAATALPATGFSTLQGKWDVTKKEKTIQGRDQIFKDYVGMTMKEHREELRSRLYDEFLPFWDKGGYDKAYGGFICNLTTEGVPVDDEKFIWYQARGILIYSCLYSNFGQDPAFLDIARKTRDFMVDKMYMGKGRWAELVHRNGTVIKGPDPQTDVYGWLTAALGLAEYYKISRDEEDLILFKASVQAALKAYDSPDYLKGTKDEGLRYQGYSMDVIRALTRLFKHHSDKQLNKLMDEHLDRLMKNFFNPKYRISNEMLNHDYSRIAGRESYMFLGHALETQWMVMDAALMRKEQSLFNQAKNNFRRYLEIGWDHIFDGWAGEHYYVFEGEDHGAGPDYSTKTMWAHMEILIGCMMTFEHTGEVWAMDWYKRVWDYVKKTFSRGTGAWEQAVNRRGEPISREKWGINPMRRGNFHQPRFLMSNMLSLDRMITN